MTDKPTRLQRLIEERIDGTLADYVRARRPDTGWRVIAADLTEVTGIEVSFEALRLWFGNSPDSTAAPERVA